jgi:hypothetical protein
MDLLIFMVIEDLMQAPDNTYVASNGVRLIVVPGQEHLWYSRPGNEAIGHHEIQQALVEYLRK